MTEIRTNTVVVSHDISSNALGRALSMAIVADLVGSVSVAAFGSGSLWSGASQFETPVARLARDWRSTLRSIARDRQCENVINVLWLCKGIAPLDSVARLFAREFPEWLVVLDVDDDDAGLSVDFMSASVLQRLMVWRRRSMLPGRIRRSQQTCASLSRGFTFASDALSVCYPSTFEPRLRVPHVRKDVAGTTVDTELVTHLLDGLGNRGPVVGVFGTLRAHKGSRMVLDAIRANRDIGFVTFAGCGLEPRTVDDVNWTEVPGSTPLDVCYGMVDCALVPITGTTVSSRVQFPAKLVDAMRAGVTIIASNTSAVDEYARGVYVPMGSDITGHDVGRLIRGSNDAGLGTSARLRFEALLAPAVVSADYREFVVRLAQ